VTSHNALDIDQKEMEAALGASDYTLAESIYTTGGNSGGKVKLTVSALTAAVAKSELVKVGTAIMKAKSAAAASDTEITLYYGDGAADTTCIRSNQAGCITTGTLYKADGTTVLGTISAGATSYRTLQGFSTAAPVKMAAGWSASHNEPQKYYQEMVDVYNSGTYGDDMISSVISSPPSGDWVGIDSLPDARSQLVKKGTVFLNVWLYVIREFEDAVEDCVEGDIAANDAPVHAWDEGVAFYTGTLEGTEMGGEDSSTGKMLHNLADKRCSNYGTCTWDTDGNPFRGKSAVNAELFRLFAIGRTHMQQGLCSYGAATKDRIAELMTIPMVQGALRYAYKVDKLGAGSEEAAEGHIFAMASIGRVNSCSAASKTTIMNNMMMTPAKYDKATGLMSSGFESVYSAFKDVYSCLNIQCSDIGGLADSKGITLEETVYYTGFEPCKDKAAGGSDDDDEDNTPMMIAVVVLAVGLLFTMAMWYRAQSLAPKLTESSTLPK
jgi:hypothetical protein